MHEVPQLKAKGGGEGRGRGEKRKRGEKRESVVYCVGGKERDVKREYILVILF